MSKHRWNFAKLSAKKLPPRVLLYVSFIAVGLMSILRGSEWLIVITLVPFLFYVEKIDLFSRKLVFKDFYFTGWIFIAISHFFLWQMAAKNWIVNIPTWITVLSRLFALLTVSTIGATSFVVFGYVLQKIPAKYRLLLLPLIYPLIELIKTMLTALINLGPGSSFSPNYYYGGLSVAASGTSLVYASRLVGFYGLSVLVVAINLSIYKLLKKRWLWTIGLVAAVSLTYTGWHMGISHTKRSLKVAWVHLNEKESLDTWDKWQELPDKLDVLILPEYSMVMKNKNFTNIAAKLNEHGLGVTSISEGNSPNSTNTLVYFNHNGEIVNKQPKTFLITTGEYLPYLLQGALWATGQDQMTSNFAHSQQVTKGSMPEHVIDNSHIKLGTLVCSGVISPSKYHRLSNEGADLLINTASLSFLKPNSVLFVHTRNMARFHAVSNNKPFVQASRSSESYYMDSQGHIKMANSSGSTQILYSQIDY